MAATLSPPSLRERARARGEPGWLIDLRVEAFERAMTLEAPAWRRTDLAGLDLLALSEKASASTGGKPRMEAPRHEGVLEMPLLEAAREHEDLVRPLLSLPATADRWECLHAALWNTGVFFHVPKEVEVAAPAVLGLDFPKAGAFARDVVHLGARASAHVVSRTTGGGPDALQARRLDLHPGEGARLSVASLQDLDRRATLLAWNHAVLPRDARLSWVMGEFGAGKSVTRNDVRLDGTGAELRFIGAFFGSDKQHLDVTTAALHHAPHTQSQLDVKGALNDDGYCANYSITYIGPDARNASGHQHQETLVLSEGAHADAIPKLDVENNEVSASHGATVGQVDPDQLFYARTRGLPELAAKRLVVEGFFEPLLREIPLEDVRAEISNAIVARLRE